MAARKTIRDIKAQKGKSKLVCLTAYAAPHARILDAHVDILLVGDSLGMVLYGMESTLAVTLPMMIQHAAAVVRGSQAALVIADMPFGTYQESKSKAFRNAAKLMAQSGCQAVKLEGGIEMAETVAFLTKRGVPVMGHLGLLPQSVHAQGGYRTHGKTEAEAEQLVQAARALEQAGAFALVLEGMSEQAARAITGQVGIPTIGIGASAQCDGQVLVTEDMAGLFEHTPSFVQQYGNLRGELDKAAKAFAAEVREGKFPAVPVKLAKKSG